MWPWWPRNRQPRPPLQSRRQHRRRYQQSRPNQRSGPNQRSLGTSSRRTARRSRQSTATRRQGAGPPLPPPPPPPRRRRRRRRRWQPLRMLAVTAAAAAAAAAMVMPASRPLWPWHDGFKRKRTPDMATATKDREVAAEATATRIAVILIASLIASTGTRSSRASCSSKR